MTQTIVIESPATLSTTVPVTASAINQNEIRSESQSIKTTVEEVIIKETTGKEATANHVHRELANYTTSINPADKLLALIAKGLQEHASQSTASQLGDRTQYIGMSDIAMMQECPRLAVLRKVEPMNDDSVSMDNYERVLKRQLTLQRGHWLEDGIANALYANGFKVIPQLELSIMAGKVPIKVHFDFVLIGENSIRPIIRVVELKSTANIPKIPSKAYETQIQGQVSLLHAYWNQPVFNLRDAHGILLYENKTFPEICHAYLGAVVAESVDTVDIQGWLLCISMNDAKAFGSYTPNAYMVNLCKKTAQFQWEYMQQYQLKRDMCSIPYAKGFCLVCSFCEYINSCPKFVGTAIPEWEKTLDELENLKALRDKTIEEISILENDIKQSIFPTDLKGKWIEAGRHRFRVTEQQGRKTLDRERLLEELMPIMGEDNVKQLLLTCETEGAPFSRIYTNIITT